MILEVIDVFDEAFETRTIRFGLEEPLNFLPGQFVSVSMKINNEKVTRAYTISSSPLQKKFIDITFRVYWQGRLTPHLYNLKKGNRINIDGPYGDFVFTDNMKNVVFIAGGTGIVPFMSMLRYIRDKNLKPKISLLYSCRTKKDIIFKEELYKICQQLSINYYLTLTRDETWKGNKGRIRKEILEKQDPSATFFVCGPPQMVADIKKIVSDLGVTEIKTEEW